MADVKELYDKATKKLEAAINQLMAMADVEKKNRYAMLLRKLLKGTLSMTSWAEG